MTARLRSFRPALNSLDRRILLSTALTPAQVRQAYNENINFTVNGKTYAANGSGQTIAIIDAGLDRTIASDLHTFDLKYGLPDPNFKSYYFQGAQNNETASGDEETALDVEWAHAVAPGANIILVQAASLNSSDLITAINWARQQPGVSVISMSFGGQESSADHTYDSIFTTPAGHAGETFVASSGDFGAWTNPQRTQVGVEWPASDPTVLSVGGTTLNLTSSGGYGSESAWSGGGGGYSKVYAEPSYQRGVQQTGVRTVPDVSYNGDPNTGVPVYSTASGGWIKVGGTSAGAPQWAGLIAIADQGRALVGLGSLDGPTQTLPSLYHFTADLHDVTTGSNGYRASAGYDVATGLGTPNGVGLIGDLAFHAITGPLTFPTTATSHPASVSPIQVQLTSVQMSPAPGNSISLAAVGAQHTAAPTTDGGIAALPGGPLPLTPPTDAFGVAASHRHHHDALDSAIDSLVAERGLVLWG